MVRCILVSHTYRKQGDGLFLECCRQVAALYPKITFDSMIVDNASMQMVSRPDKFDVVVTPNLYGTILGNIGAGLVGSAGLVAGFNVGNDFTLFEPVIWHC
jgi:isocitrate dehydrogenase (NAD+)